MNIADYNQINFFLNSLLVVSCHLREVIISSIVKFWQFLLVSYCCCSKFLQIQLLNVWCYSSGNQKSEMGLLGLIMKVMMLLQALGRDCLFQPLQAACIPWLLTTSFQTHYHSSWVLIYSCFSFSLIKTREITLDSAR